MKPRPKTKSKPKPKPESANGKGWPAAKIEHWPLERLQPYDRNARTHSPKQIDQIVASMKKWGWTTPILIDEDGGILAGHGRVAAAQKMGHVAMRVPVMIARGWSDEEKRAYRLADNQIALNSGWDRELLSMELSELSADDIGLLGFSDDALGKLLDESPATAGIKSFTPLYQVLIECGSEQDQLLMLEKLQKDGIACRALIA